MSKSTTPNTAQQMALRWLAVATERIAGLSSGERADAIGLGLARMAIQAADEALQSLEPGDTAGTADLPRCTNCGDDIQAAGVLGGQCAVCATYDDRLYCDACGQECQAKAVVIGDCCGRDEYGAVSECCGADTVDAMRNVKYPDVTEQMIDAALEDAHDASLWWRAEGVDA